MKESPFDITATHAVVSSKMIDVTTGEEVPFDLISGKGERFPSAASCGMNTSLSNADKLRLMRGALFNSDGTYLDLEPGIVDD